MSGKRKARVAVGLSGGVDSSVAAALLKEQGYDVVGVTMAVYAGSLSAAVPKRHACYGPGESGDIESASRLCRKLGIPYHVVDLKDEYARFVLSHVKREYLKGRTPNPCVVCNQKVKFGFLLDRAAETGLDFEYFATGHYARIAKLGERFHMRTAVDGAKDQTYFLYALPSALLSKILFPVGSFTKSQVRAVARSYGLETSERAESQDFLETGDYAAIFGEEELREGEIVDERGNAIGTHRGIIHYTRGQRRGLGVSSAKPLYVMDIDPDRNTITVGHKERLYSKGLLSSDMKFAAPELLERSKKVKAKIRLRHEAAEATAKIEGENGRILFDVPQFAVTPGQSVVLYSGEIVAGGGVIDRAF